MFLPEVYFITLLHIFQDVPQNCKSVLYACFHQKLPGHISPQKDVVEQFPRFSVQTFIVQSQLLHCGSAGKRFPGNTKRKCFSKKTNPLWTREMNTQNYWRVLYILAREVVTVHRVLLLDKLTVLLGRCGELTQHSLSLFASQLESS